MHNLGTGVHIEVEPKFHVKIEMKNGMHIEPGAGFHLTCPQRGLAV